MKPGRRLKVLFHGVNEKKEQRRRNPEGGFD